MATETPAAQASPRATAAGDAACFADYARPVKAALDAALAAHLADVAASVRHLPADVQASVEAVRDLTLRGGKRLRAVLLAATYDACGGEGGAAKVVLAGVAFELLQSYLLIHDDWMDADDVRRGGPSVPAMLRAHFGAASARTADAFTILAGDLAAGLALEALGRVPVSPDRVAAAAREMGRIQRDVVLGQMCDLQGELTHEPPTEAAVDLTHTLKTGSYTVRGPVAIGAHLAGASDALVLALTAFADPLGIAFQLRDDVLGTFGDPDRTGKPATGDIRQGKRTGLIAALAADTSQATATLVARTFGNAEASPADVDALVALLVSSGARARVERRIDALLAQALRALEGADISSSGRAVLESAAYTLVHREK
jgi:geranylgeranyl diphosphate synthase type I